MARSLSAARTDGRPSTTSRHHAQPRERRIHWGFSGSMKMIGKLRTMFDPELAKQDLAWDMDRFIEVIDPAIAKLPGYRKTLEPAARFALQYCTELAAVLPGPYPVSEQAHSADPLLDALFPRREDIPAAFGRSLEMRDRLREIGSAAPEQVHALMGLRQRVSAAPPGTPANLPRAWTKPRFVDHTLRSLAVQEDGVRQAFASAAFESLRHGFLQQIEQLRRCRKMMHNEEQLMREMAGAQDDDPATILSDDTRALLEADLSPAALLARLAAWLQAPHEYLRLEMGHEDAMVILPHPDPAQRGLQKLELPVLVGMDRRRWPVCLVRFSYQEALTAVERESMAHRYILI